ncbi:MAG: hypothetical protein ABSC18_07545 [Verrucomicrobiota bacterium]|jgi:hypothetical protein
MALPRVPAAIGRGCGLVWRAVGLLAVLVIWFSPAPARADDDDAGGSTNREKRPIEELFKTDVVYPQEVGELEVELASAYQNHAGGDTWTIPVSLEYGLTDSWQVEGGWDCLVERFPRDHSVVRGVGDLEAGTQYSFMNIGGSLFHIAPRFTLQAPVGDVNKDLSEGFMEYEPAVILARDFPELHRTQVFTEIGAGFVQRVNAPANAADAQPAAHELSLGSGFLVLFPRAAATFEFNWANNKWNHHGTENEMYLTPGCLWRARRNMEVGLGIPVGLNSGSDRFDVMAHVVWEF